MSTKHAQFLSLIPLCCFATAVGLNFTSLDHHQHGWKYLVGSALLASPLFFLAVGHLMIAKGWQSHLFLLAGNLLFGLAVLLVLFLMRWFQAGWFGIGVFTLGQLCAAAIYLVATWAIHDRAAAVGK